MKQSLNAILVELRKELMSVYGGPHPAEGCLNIMGMLDNMKLPFFHEKYAVPMINRRLEAKFGPEIEKGAYLLEIVRNCESMVRKLLKTDCMDPQRSKERGDICSLLGEINMDEAVRNYCVSEVCREVLRAMNAYLSP